MEDLMDFIWANVSTISHLCILFTTMNLTARKQLQLQLPDVYDELSLYCKILPLNANTLAFPFSGVVVNLCVSTTAHRDHTAQQICVVIPFGEWEGGDL